MALFSDDSVVIFYGIIIVVMAVVFLLSSLGVFWKSTYIIDDRLDLVIAFILIVFGLALIFSQAGKPGKPKFEVSLGEQKFRQ
ncbi:MAG: hypothetical protein JW772_04920 [Candidatus Diapherotrites archaeon]|nr:hypothetical protein [Candidatus Diapherotrites archaeon]